MATSGTYNFNLDIDEVIQEATEMIGGEQTLGHTPQSARRSINLRRDSTDIELQRISFEEYLNIPNKTQTGRPTQFTVKRNLANPTVFVWPLPDNTTDTLQIEAIRQLEDVNKSADQNADSPVRFLPALTCGLAYYLSMKRTGIPMDRIGMLKQNYEEKLARAMEEDRERASLLLKPRYRYV